MAGIPGLDVTELGPDGRPLQLRPQQPWSGASPQAQAWQAGRTPGTAPPPAAPVAPKPPATRGLTVPGGGMLSKTLASAGKLNAVGGALGAGVDMYQNGVNAVNTTDMLAASTALRSPNPVMAAGGAGWALGRTIGHFLPDDVNTAIGGTINNALRGVGLGEDDSDYRQRLAAQRMGVDNSTTQLRPRPGTVAAAPTTASATDSAQEAFRRSELTGNAPRPKLDPNDPRILRVKLGHASTGLDTEEGRAIEDRARAIDAQTAAVQRGLDQYEGLSSGNGGMTGITDDGRVHARNEAQFDKDQAMYMLRHGQLQAGRALMGLVNQKAQGHDQLDITRLKENGETARANSANALRGQIAGMENRTALRGQDITREGHYLTNGVAKAQAQYQMYKDNRDFALRSDETNFKQREEGDKALTSRLESMFTTRDPDGKTVIDRDRVGVMKGAVMNHLAGLQRELAAIPQSSPDYAEAQKRLKQIDEKGPALIDSDTLAKLSAREEARARAKNAASNINPLKGSFVDSPEPNAYDIVGEKKNLIFPDQYQLRNGSTVPKGVLDRAEPGLFNIFGDRTTRFDVLNEMKKGQK